MKVCICSIDWMYNRICIEICEVYPMIMMMILYTLMMLMHAILWYKWCMYSECTSYEHGCMCSECTIIRTIVYVQWYIQQCNGSNNCTPSIRNFDIVVVKVQGHLWRRKRLRTHVCMCLPQFSSSLYKNNNNNNNKILRSRPSQTPNWSLRHWDPFVCGTRDPLHVAIWLQSPQNIFSILVLFMILH